MEGVSKFPQKIFSIVFVMAFTCSLAAESAQAGEQSGQDSDEPHHTRVHESKFYGTVEHLPKDILGTWVVNGREIVVTKDTRIQEKHGKVETGVYVEVEGNNEGKTFTAYEIKVKRSRLRQ